MAGMEGAGSLVSQTSATLDSLMGQGRLHHTQAQLAAAWRLKPVATDGSAGEMGIRLPPLQPGQSFGDLYEVPPLPPKAHTRPTLHPW